MLIQALLVLAFLAVAFIDMRSSGGARHQAIRRILLLGFVVLAIVSVLFPDLVTWAARNLGVGRGTDLVLYALVVAFLSFIATTYRRLSAFDRKITVLARQLALTEARLTAEEKTHTRETSSDQ